MKQVTTFKDGVTITITERGYSITYADGTKETFDKFGKKIAKRREMMLLSEVGMVGDYIAYSPKITEYVVSRKESGVSDQKYNLSKLKNWRLFKNEDNVLEIINFDAPSLTVKGASGFTNLIGILNGFADACVDPRYAVAGRSIGSSIRSIPSVNIPTWRNVSKNRQSTIYHDEEFVHDRDQMKKYCLTLPEDIPFWLASRFSSSSNNYTIFGAWIMKGNSVVSGDLESWLYGIKSNKTDSISNKKAVAPVVELLPDVRISGGDGSYEKPYRLKV